LSAIRKLISDNRINYAIYHFMIMSKPSQWLILWSVKGLKASTSLTKEIKDKVSRYAFCISKFFNIYHPPDGATVPLFEIQWGVTVYVLSQIFHLSSYFHL